ncbi:ABC transporter permease [Rubrivirga sp. S365]|uniref:ABC transporter permease n=1 Tax=Rubrivirga litoralis TaxID=3075598 RepID=A0ABU3BP67_9BACT|nr:MULTISPECIES: ABC transporter permease [unclassified Rubrivirga]MDT0631058.1 ABC transporter permease [Rubrivirga sp. F394]MDT7855084.1 ABC transporter permease [Rubrivirga sp. S365]
MESSALPPASTPPEVSHGTWAKVRAGVAPLWAVPAALVGGFGAYCLLLARAFNLPRDLSPRLYARNLAEQMVKVGIDSIPIVSLATAFSGGVIVVQAVYQLENPLLPLTIVGTFAEQSILLELGTLVTAFVLCGRVGARIAAELGTMRVKEQIDALEAMGLNSQSYLVVPRVVAGVLMFPVLYVVAATVGMVTGGVVAEFSGISVQTFWEGARLFFRPYDVVFGLIKSVVFGFVITSIACYTGYQAEGGASGVGEATTRAAVLGCVFVLLADYLCAVVLL